MSLSQSTTWTGRTLTVGVLRELAAWTAGMDINEPVNIRVSPGDRPWESETILIQITRTERQEK